ncbi:hypothetical protein, partial [Streptococcus pneumoniae]|uniref:hypothetical protein n=1 Tax=Streptococcus pneumoniae TaxID=1313 RepID=UPI001CB7926A
VSDHEGIGGRPDKVLGPDSSDSRFGGFEKRAAPLHRLTAEGRDIDLPGAGIQDEASRKLRKARTQVRHDRHCAEALTHTRQGVSDHEGIGGRPDKVLGPDSSDSRFGGFEKRAA